MTPGVDDATRPGRSTGREHHLEPDPPSSRAAPLGLVTSEAVELEIPTASVGLRGLAVVVDLFVLAVVTLLVFLGTSAVLSAVAAGSGAGEAAVWVVVVVTTAVVVLFPAVVEALTSGRSLGKAWVKLRVVTVEAGPIGWSHALIRATAGAFELLATGGLLALLVALASPRGQRLGDMVAGTLVVREAVSRADIRPSDSRSRQRQAGGATRTRNAASTGTAQRRASGAGGRRR